MPSDAWRHRARRAIVSRWRDGLGNGEGIPEPHFVVCGNDALAYRLILELILGAGARITVLATGSGRHDTPDVRTIKGVRVVKVDRLDEEAFRRAELERADALALVHQDDVGNLHAALCAQEVNANVRLVIRMFNTNLASGVRRLFADCAVMSDASMAAPAFVAAALGEVAPSHFRLHGRTLHLAKRADVRPEDVVCGLADTSPSGTSVVLPADQNSADLVLAEATGRPVGTVVAARRIARDRRRRRPAALTMRALRSMVNRKLGVATLGVLVLVVAAGAGLAWVNDVSGWAAVYLALMTTISGAEADLKAGAGVQLLQVIMVLAGLALIPLITAAVVDAIVHARLALAAGRLQDPRQDHVVVVGLGNVGTRVIRQLTDLGIDVVAIDKRADARGNRAARQLGIPLIIGDAAQEETLHAASIRTSQALVVVSTDDVTNLETALNARAAKPGLRVVLRLFDGDLADRIQRAFDIDVSRSVSYLAAPAFAAAMMERDVIATIPVDRHVLLVAEVSIARTSALDGAQVGDATRPHGVRVIAVRQFGEPRAMWSPPPAYRVAAGDRLIVVARRGGLTWLLDRAAAPDEAPPPTAPEQPAPPEQPTDRGRPTQRTRNAPPAERARNAPPDT
ncbi:MAG TPA: NAD-binding protein [Micromonosporaceae bacterium]